jgi:hypothetical protein
VSWNTGQQSPFSGPGTEFRVTFSLLAVILGIIGVVSSVSPKVGGGLVSIIAIILGVLDIGVAILGIIGVIIF